MHSPIAGSHALDRHRRLIGSAIRWRSCLSVQFTSSRFGLLLFLRWRGGSLQSLHTILGSPGSPIAGASFIDDAQPLREEKRVFLRWLLPLLIAVALTLGAAFGFILEQASQPPDSIGQLPED